MNESEGTRVLEEKLECVRNYSAFSTPRAWDGSSMSITYCGTLVRIASQEASALPFTGSSLKGTRRKGL